MSMSSKKPEDYESHGSDPIRWVLEATSIARSQSMDVTNDPRFFSDNVLNYRLSAFAGLSVVSGLMIQNAMDHIFDMDKRMDLDTVDGCCQCAAFFVLLVVLFLNVVSTYVGVAQPYHTVRLMTAGPTGFETAASYYLNASVVSYRHLAIKAMLVSLPLFVIQGGLRLVMKFDRENGYAEGVTLSRAQARNMGIASAAICIVMGIFIFYIHGVHSKVFRDRYETMSTPPAMQAHMQSLMNPRAMATMGPDAETRRGFFNFPDV